MKGIIEWAIVGTMISFSMILVVIIPLIVLKIHLVEEVSYEFKYDNAQLALLTLLSSTYNNKPISDIIAENLTLGNYPNIEKILSSKLNRISSCYKLSTETIDIIKSANCEASKFRAEANVALPYSKEKLAEKIILVID
jgi:hypothetical protein